MSERVVNSLVDLAFAAAEQSPQLETRLATFQQAVTEDPFLAPQLEVDPETLKERIRFGLKVYGVLREGIGLYQDLRRTR